MTGIVVASLLWDANEHSQPFSRCYDESWARRLYWGFRRNLTIPWRFVLFVDRQRDLPPEIEQELLRSPKPNYGTCIEPYRLDEPMILVGLDTVVLRNIDHLAQHCLVAEKVGLPRDPFWRSRACNGVALVPPNHRHIFDGWRGENDMEWMRKHPHDFTDDLFPGEIGSYKGAVLGRGIGEMRIVYFHGHPKMHELPDVDWIRANWREGE